MTTSRSFLVTLIAVSCVTGAAGAARAEEIAVPGCSVVEVQAAVDAADPGDELVLPACTVTWSSSVVVDRPLTIRGAGESATVLTGGGAAFFDADIEMGGLFRVTDMGMQGRVDGEAISINGRALFRIDHCHFEDITGRSIFLGYQNWASPDVPALRGLIDHVTFVASESRTPIMVYGRDDAWLRPENYGTDDAVFVEDNTFLFAVPGVNSSVLDGEHGARFVVRFNRVVNGQIQQHDTGSTPQGRGTRAIEVYGNRFECDVPDCGNSVFGIRGGTGLIYDNVIEPGYETPTFTQIYRVTADGSEPWASRCDSVSERVCSTFFSHCTAGDHRTCFGAGECPAGSCVGECTGDGDCPSGSTCVQLDGHLEASGWPCRDQTGRGVDDPVTHIQASAPLYFWANTAPGGAPFDLYVATANAAYIEEDRDYCNHDPSTPCGSVGPFSYTPFPHPHPLAGGAPPPDAGTTTDAGEPRDAGGAMLDAADAGGASGASGCACRAAHRTARWPSAALMTLLLVVAWERARSRRIR
jgi:hypothetical protein